MKAFDWRGNPTSPAALLGKYRMTITPGPIVGWHVVELRETHGRPELRNIVQGTTAPTLFEWLNMGRSDLKSEMKRDMATGIDENVLNLNVNAGSYYNPAEKPGPHSVKVRGDSAIVSGWGLALGVPDQPSKDEDNRYLTLIVVWAWGSGTTEPPAPPTDPPKPPSPGESRVTRADLLRLRASLVATRDRADGDIAFLDRLLEGIP